MIRRLGVSRVLIVVGLAVAVAALVLALPRPRTAPYEVRVLGYASDTPVQELLTDLERLGPEADLVFSDLAEGTAGQRFSRLLAVINTGADIPLLPDSVERRTAPPYIHFHNQNRYYSQYLSSVTGVFHRERLVAVAVGGQWYGEGFWEGFLAEEHPVGEVRVFVPSGTYTITDEALMTEMARLLRG